LLNSMTLKGVRFDINSDGEYVITIGNEVIHSDQAKATYMALTGLETGYQIGLAKASGSDPDIYNKPLRLKDTKLAKAYKQARQDVKDLTEENNYLLSESWKMDVLKEAFMKKLNDKPEKVKYYFTYLYTNNKITPADKHVWANEAMIKLSQGISTDTVFHEKIKEILITRYFHEMWNLW